jgi:hypothetical protein
MKEFFNKELTISFLIEKLCSISFLRWLVFAEVFFHFFTWSFPFPSEAEATSYLQGLRGDSFGACWILLIRLIDAIFMFGYAKFAFVLIGIACIYLVYDLFTRLADPYVALIAALIFAGNGYLLTIWHSTQPEIFIIFIFLLCIFLFVRFFSCWHSDIYVAGYRTVVGISISALIMINTDTSGFGFIPSVVLMNFFVFNRMFDINKALISTTITTSLFLALQFFISPTWINIVFVKENYSFINFGFIKSLELTYIDGYASPLWKVVHKNLDFLSIHEGSLRAREFISIFSSGFIFFALLVMKVLRLTLLKRKFDLKSFFYTPHFPLIIVFLVVFLVFLFLDFGSRGLSKSYLAYQVISLILFCLCIYTFLQRATRSNLSVSLESRFGDLVYQPIAIVATCIILTLGFLNSYAYVTPYRGSNYPAINDAIGQMRKGAGCEKVGYSTQIYAAALNTGQSIPPKSIKDLYEDISKGRSLNEGCIIMPLIARDRVYEYSLENYPFEQSIENFLAKNYRVTVELKLPFYQRDPAYPFSLNDKSNLNLSNGSDRFMHVHGHESYKFGGWEDVVIYKLYDNKP